MSFSPRSKTRTGSQSAEGSSDDSIAGTQYSRIKLPIGVPGPIRVMSSLSSCFIMAWVPPLGLFHSTEYATRHPMLRVEDLRMRYRTDQGEVEAVRGLSLNVERGQFFTLLGPSGCGKTSTLRCIAGLETPTSGSIEIDAHIVYASASRPFVPPHRRHIGMVFQSYAIWPHMTGPITSCFGSRTLRRAPQGSSP